jgi:Uma2 family endonuclease
MATVARIGPDDHGRPMSLDEFLAGDYEEGHQYELIDGELYVTPLPDPSQNIWDSWLFYKMYAYSVEHPAVISYVTNKARVFVPGRAGITIPEPDLAAYRNFPLDRPFREIRWQNVSPLVVGEIVSQDDPNKDWIRNVELYLQVPSIKEYWVIDARADPGHPTLTVHRRHGKQWRVLETAPGETYTTKLLPGFKLHLDLHR